MADKHKGSILFSCSGASNCGQIVNQVAVTLAERGMGNMSCVAGIGAHNQKMIDAAQSANKKVVVIDGCAVACAKKILEHAGINVEHWICVTNEGIKKTHDKLNIFDIAHEEITRISQRARALIQLDG